MSTVEVIEPAWVAVRPAAVTGLAPRTLLHAGPPFADPAAIPRPVLNSAVIAALHEGWADDMAAAEALIRDGSIKLEPAATRQISTPLAEVVGPSTSLTLVTDIGGGLGTWAAPLPSGLGPQARFGTRDPGVLRRLKFRDETLAPALAATLRGWPIPLLPLARAGLEGGDDLHGRTTSATAALASVLTDRIAGEVEEAVAGMPLFFLTLWMAACRLIALGLPDSFVASVSGNGVEVGVELCNGARVKVPAPVADGPRLAAGDTTAPSPAVGDSLVIDALGFGGQALDASPEIADAVGPFMPAGAGIPQDRLAVDHAALGRRLGLDAARAGEGPDLLMAFGMIDAEGEKGLLGRGVAALPAAAIAKAVAAD